MKIFIIDAGIGNVGSIMSMLKRIGLRGQLIDAPCRLELDERLILPGVGAFDAGMAAIVEKGFDVWLRDMAAQGNLILGICLGMQVLFERSEEGEKSGLGLIPGEVVRLAEPASGLRLPHMGWNVARPVKDSWILPLSSKDQRFYFVHSYCARCTNPSDILAVTEYGGSFVSAVGRGNLFGVQFHPEKSHRFGLELLERFASVPLGSSQGANQSC
jgi:glutamine amidotransferase